MSDLEWQARVNKLEKTVKVLERRLESCVEMRKNIEVIRDSQAMLFEKVHKELEDSRQVIVLQNREIRTILSHIEQGIVVVGEDLKVAADQSAFVSELIGRQPAAEERLDDLLFRNCSLSRDVVSQVMSIIIASANEPDFMFTCNKHGLPSEYVIYAAGGDKIIEIDWNPIVNDAGIVERLIVALRDVTELRKLRLAAAEKHATVKLISEIVEHDFEDVVRFLDDSTRFVAENIATIRANRRTPQAVEGLFRNAHTVKGNARAFAFDWIVNLVHQVETHYQQIRVNPLMWNSEIMLAEANNILEALAAYYAVLAGKLRFKQQRDGSDFQGDVLRLLGAVDLADPAGQRDVLGQLVELYHDYSYRPLADLIQTPLASLPGLAAQLGKPAPRVEVDSDLRLHRELTSLLTSIYNHCLRNNVDHGLETPAARRLVGKPAEGTIRLGAGVVAGALRLTIEDDGAGLALDALRPKAEALGLIAAAEDDDAKIADVVFHSGVSTADAVSDISGRGVGMDAVRAFLAAHGGRVDLAFTGPRRGSGRRPFQLVITLPLANTVDPRCTAS